MEAKVVNLENLLKYRQQWVVPVYQRHYEWKTGADQQMPYFWEDLMKMVESVKSAPKTPCHYFGAIITLQEADVIDVAKNDLVDGQQRITTFKLALIAMRQVACDMGDKKLEEKIEGYLFNKDDKDAQKYKFWPSHFDRDNFMKIIDNSWDDLPREFPDSFNNNNKIKKSCPHNLLRAYGFLYNKVSEYIEKKDDGEKKEALCNLLNTFLTRFEIVLIQKVKDPQQIFSSLNALSEPLSPFDLVRNDILHRAKKQGKQGKDLENFYDEEWLKFEEEDFWNKTLQQGRLKQKASSHFITHSVIAEVGKVVNHNRIDSEYRRFAKGKWLNVDEEIKYLRNHAENYKKLIEGSDENHSTYRLGRMLKDWDTSTFHPVILMILKKQFSKEFKKKLFLLIESYLVRRSLCRLTSKSYNDVAVNLISAVKDIDCEALFENTFLESFKSAADSTRFPSNEDVKSACLNEKFYKIISSSKRRYIFTEIEKEMRTKNDENIEIKSDKLTTEHIMPQEWRKNWNEHPPSNPSERDEIIHTIGNLTLVTHQRNSGLSNKSWEEKRKQLEKSSRLELNMAIWDEPKWDEGKIEKRSKELAESVVEIWAPLETF
jgi:uncharacterized protein with ParB-like and HNH nuclease domain